MKLKVLLADDNQQTQSFLLESLEKLGHHAIAVESVDGVIEAFSTFKPDLVLTDIALRGLDVLSVARELRSVRPVPIIVLGSSDEVPLIQEAIDEQVFALLVKPITTSELQAVIEITMNRFSELEGLQTEAAALRQELIDRKYIERAKGILMKEKKISESEAFQLMQSSARQKRIKLIDIANAILMSEEMRNA